MPASADIWNNLKGAELMEGYNEGLKIKELGLKRDAAKLEAQNKIKKQEAIKNAMGPDGKVDQTKLTTTLAGLGMGEDALTMGRELTKDTYAANAETRSGESHESNQKKAKLEGAKQELELTSQLLGGVFDQASYDQARNEAQRQGLDVSQLPPDYRPELMKSLHGRTLTAKDRLDQEWKQLEHTLNKEKFGHQVKSDDRKYSLDVSQFDFTKTKDNRNFGLEQEKFGYSKEKDQKDFGLKEREVKAKERESINGKQLPSDKVLLVNEGNSIPTMLTSIKDTIKNNGDAFGPIAGRLGSMNPYDTKSQTIDSQVRAASQAFGRYMEGGVLRKEDEEKYRKMFPTLSDTPAVAANKLAIVEKLLVDKQTSNVAALKNSGYDTSGVTQKLEGGQLPAILGGQNTVKNLEAMPDDQLDALFNQLQGK